MIIDNKKEGALKVHEWVRDLTKSGKMDIVTGYFTIGALKWLSDLMNEQISHFRFIIGDIVNTEVKEERPLDLLNENVTIDAVLKLKQVAKDAVTFLEQSGVKVRTIEPNFCHAKAIIYKSGKKPHPNDYYITGSSNLTEAGIGLKETNNIELNVVGQGTDPTYTDVRDWFDNLWEQDEVVKKKSVDGEKVDFKKYLIAEIYKVFKEYSPKDIYFKILFELFGRQIIDFESDPEIQKYLTRMKNSVVYNTLYDFQQKGVLSLIKMLEEYNGAILADAVGLGKTWQALAVMKYYQNKKYDVFLLCPKKLSQNWMKYEYGGNSKFEDDQLNYVVRYHTDLFEKRLETKDSGRHKINGKFVSSCDKIFVIDESHNLRNKKSGRYKFFVEEILKKNKALGADCKILMLSATPINNGFGDIINQFSLITADDDAGFSEHRELSIPSLKGLTRGCTNAFNNWTGVENKTVDDLIKELPGGMVRLINMMVVSRTRKMIKGTTDGLDFPKANRPDNYYLGEENIGEFNGFINILNALPSKFAAYQPSAYISGSEGDSVLTNEKQRDQMLVRMINILFVKRLESSWFSFYSTVKKILAVHKNTLDAVINYQQGSNQKLEVDDEQLDFGESDFDFEIGKRQIRLSLIAKDGNLNEFKNDLEHDVKRLNNLKENLAHFAASGAPDQKLEKLIEIITDKQGNQNKKILIFTAYKSTAQYIYDKLSKKNFTNLAVVSGSGAQTSETGDIVHKDFEPTLEKFAPFTKLFVEKEWPAFRPSEDDLSLVKQYDEWTQWTAKNCTLTSELLQNPIDILIATDCLSEGQNLQDCDLVINYDIHWNPVRIIQRFGRIDRLGSPNKEVKSINFWPTDDIDSYLRLKSRVENRMAAMAIAGTEINLMNNSVESMVRDQEFLASQEGKMLAQVDSASWDDIEDDSGVCFSDLSLEFFKQDLMVEYQKDEEKFSKMPLGLYSGFLPKEKISDDELLVALLGYKVSSKKTYKKFNLVCVDSEGKSFFDNDQEILKFLQKNQDQTRAGCQAIDMGEEKTIRTISSALKKWLKSKITNEDGTAGEAVIDLINDIQQGNITQSQPSKGKTIEDEFDPENRDLLAWMIVSNK